MDLQVISQRPAVDPLSDDWTDLLDRAAESSVFLTPEWMTSWWDAYGAPLRMHLLTVTDRGRLVALAPLALSADHTMTSWSNDYTDRFGLAVEDGRIDAIELIARHLADDHSWRSLNLHPLESESPLFEPLCGALEATGCGTRAIETLRSPWLELPGDPDVITARLSRSFRQSLRRKLRAAERAGLAAEHHTTTDVLDDVFDVALDTWAHRDGTGLGSTPENERFYRSLAAAAEERGWLRIHLLRKGDRAIAFEFNLVRDGDAVNLKVGYREADRDRSPGLVLRSQVIEHLIGEGARSFDLLGQEETYKLHWADRVRPHVRLRAFPPTAAGRLNHLYRNRLRPAMRRLVKRWRPGVD
jgi:CelD/BcsL family acetyltransferase involved in cellulose biosynthesis